MSKDDKTLDAIIDDIFGKDYTPPKNPNHGQDTPGDADTDDAPGDDYDPFGEEVEIEYEDSEKAPAPDQGQGEGESEADDKGKDKDDKGKDEDDKGKDEDKQEGKQKDKDKGKQEDKKNPDECFITIRVTKEERDYVDSCAKRHGMNRTDYVRIGLGLKKN